MLAKLIMFSVNRIVVATDMSLLATRAGVRAAMLARELGCESLDLLHIVDAGALELLSNLVQPSTGAEHHLMNSTRKYMAEAERQLSEKYCIPVTTAILNMGRTHAEIVRYAELVDAGLVVLGAHSGGIVRQMFVGSTVDKVLRTLARPVLIVKEEPRASYQQILVPVDCSESSRRGIEIAMRIAPNGKITVLHAFEAPYEAKLRFEEVSEETIHAYRAQLQAQKDKELRQFVSQWESAEGSLFPTVEFGPAAAVIQEKAKSLGSDLVVIGKHGQSAWEDMLLGSVTKQVIQEVSCDVLVVGQVEAAK
jgi:nucleotide-binding universal stress UspA family protein